MSAVVGEPVGIHKLWLTLRRYRKTIPLIVVASLLIALAVSFVVPPVYRGEVLLAPSRHAIDENGLSGGALGLLKGLQLPRDGMTAEAIAISRSRQFLERFITNHDLMPILFADRWNAETKSWRGEAPTLEDGYLKFFGSALKVRIDDETGFVRLQVDARTADTAARMANDLVGDLNDEIRERVVTEGTKDLKYLHERMADSPIPEVRSSIANLIKERTKEVMLATNRGSYVFRTLQPAVPSKYRAFPKRSLVMVAGCLVGVLLSMGWVAVRESWDKRAVS